MNGNKLQPKLRMVRNCDTNVNAIRAEHAGAIAVKKSSILDSLPLCRLEIPEQSVATKKLKRKIKKKLPTISPDTYVNVFIELAEGSNEIAAVKGETSRIGKIATAEVSLSEVDQLVENNDISYISLGDQLKLPEPKLSTAQGEIASGKAERNVPLTLLHNYGSDVLIGIIDVQGFAFDHQDFLDAQGNTRFIRIWDQDGDARPPPAKNNYSRF